jgi:perosamine synthetase
MNVGPGDVVGVPNLTYVATANAVAETGAEVRLVEVDLRTWVVREWPAECSVIMPVALFGKNPQPLWGHKPHPLFGMDPQPAWGRVISDYAQGHGMELFPLGPYEVRCYSFYGNKILTCGEGGMVCTNDAVLKERLIYLRGHATRDKYFHTEHGFNFRLTELQAAIGYAQTESLAAQLSRRRAIERAYLKQLKPLIGKHEITLQKDRTDRDVPWLFPILVHPFVREQVVQTLARHGVETRPCFTPLSRLPMYRNVSLDGRASDWLHERMVVLPLHARMSESDVTTICNALKEVLECCQ